MRNVKNDGKYGMDNLENKINNKLNQVSQQIDREVENLGYSIDHLVQNAVDSSNYRDLSNKIDRIVNQGVEQIQHTVSRGNQNAYGQRREQPRARRELFVRSGGLFGAGIAFLVIGIILTVIFGILTAVDLVLLTGTAGAVARSISLAVFVFFAVILGIGIVLDVLGSRRMKLVQRYKKYVSFLADRTVTRIPDLSFAVQIPEQTVRRDVRKIIQKGWFREGHLDENEICLMLTNEAWTEYCGNQEELRKNRRRQQEEQRRSEAFGNQNPQVMEVLNEGENYLRELRACNAAIPEAGITGKISRMEVLTQRIFERIRRKPEQVDEIHKLMKYYLPTAIKLLHAYEEMNAQSVQGENIVSSKREIEEALDTLNTAFEKLLDHLFEDAAWDVSSDISVLNTILAQDGLKDDGSGF